MRSEWSGYRFKIPTSNNKFCHYLTTKVVLTSSHNGYIPNFIVVHRLSHKFCNFLSSFMRITNLDLKTFSTNWRTHYIINTRGSVEETSITYANMTQSIIYWRYWPLNASNHLRLNIFFRIGYIYYWKMFILFVVDWVFLTINLTILLILAMIRYFYCP